MESRQELSAIKELICSKDIECRKLGIDLFMKSQFMDQFKGNKVNITFLFPTCGKYGYLLVPYRTLNKALTSYILDCFINNQYKAFINLKNNRIWQ